MVVAGFNVNEMGGRRAINIVLKVGLNGVLKRREVEVRTAEMEFSEAVCLIEPQFARANPSQNSYRLS